ncbi:MAG: hypothetical protein GAK45_02055 [Pseudomonas citronellolis]|nr:MAG: hypothetical protein GAK45_02055 [Pseudomonas citronellolis]
MASWDIFCSVVDNYGDIGVTWRLARQLAREHGQAVRLWVDDLSAFARLCPEADVACEQQWQSGVEIRHWPATWMEVEPADVVIEAFACTLPETYVARLGARTPAPLWINLEYLSAEDWIVDCHGLPSLQANGVAKYFYFPGFQPDSGGVLREQGLLEQRDAFQADAQARRAFLAAQGVSIKEGERLVSLFAYENPALAGWLDTLAGAVQATLLLVPEGRICADVAAWLGLDAVQAGECHARGHLRLQVLPFLRQQEYDRLLWSCDLNAVRGEDSFVRAQWAGRPLLWHIYPQEEETHLEKLDAFLQLYSAAMPSPLAESVRRAWGQWNGRELGDGVWQGFDELLQVWMEPARQWSAALGGRTDLAAGLVRFYTNWL